MWGAGLWLENNPSLIFFCDNQLQSRCEALMKPGEMLDDVTLWGLKCFVFNQSYHWCVVQTDTLQTRTHFLLIRITSTLWWWTGDVRKRPVIREGQIAGLGPPAICRLAELIPRHGMGLPGSDPITLHPTSFSPELAPPTFPCPTASHQYWHWPVSHVSGALSGWFALTSFYLFDTQGMLKQRGHKG